MNTDVVHNSADKRHHKGREVSVDDKFLGVSAPVAVSGVLCFALGPRRLTAG